MYYIDISIWSSNHPCVYAYVCASCVSSFAKHFLQPVRLPPHWTCPQLQFWWLLDPEERQEDLGWSGRHTKGTPGWLLAGRTVWRHPPWEEGSHVESCERGGWWRYVFRFCVKKNKVCGTCQSANRVFLPLEPTHVLAWPLEETPHRPAWSQKM